MMKKGLLLAAVCSIVILDLYLIGCGGSTETTTTLASTTTTTTTTGSTTTTTPTAAKILFQSAHSPWAIWQMNPDGTSQEAIPFSGAGVSSFEGPAVSPDRTKIAYVKIQPSGPYTFIGQICVANADGTGEQQLTGSTEGSSDPSWSPDGSKIIFQRGGNSIRTITPGGTEEIIISSMNGAARPSYLDNSTLLFMAAGVGGKPRIFRYTLPSGPATDLASVSADPAGTYAFFTPKGSPDGSKVAFCSNRDCKDSAGQQRELYFMNADGSSVVQLTHRTSTDASSSYDNFRPTWSPDGTQLVFYSNLKNDMAGTTWDIWLINLSGTGEVNLTKNTYMDENPSWQ